MLYFQTAINEKVLIGQIELADNVSTSVSANSKQVLTQLKKVKILILLTKRIFIFLGGILRQRTNPETSSIQSASTNNDDNTIS